LEKINRGFWVDLGVDSGVHFLTQYQIFWHMFNFFKQLWCFDFLRVHQIKMTSENLKYNILPIFFFVLCTTSGCSTVKAVSIIQGGTPHLESSNRGDVNVNIFEMAHFLIVKTQINNSSNLYNFIIDTASLTVIDEKDWKYCARKMGAQDAGGGNWAIGIS